MNPLHRVFVGLPGGCRDRAHRHRRCRKKDQVLCPDRSRAVLRRAATPAFGPAEDNDCDFWDRALVAVVPRLRATHLGLLMLGLLGLACAKVNSESDPSETEHDADDCPVGSDGCPCTTGGACDPGLHCVDDRCEEPEPTDPNDEIGPFDESTYGDLPDCYEGCGVPYRDAPFEVQITATEGETRFTVNGERRSSLIGTIDGEDHSSGWGYDLDMVRVRIRPRTLLEILVEPTADSELDPYVSTYDPVLIPMAPLNGWLTQNDDASENGSAARTVIAAPVLDEESWLVAVDDARNVAGAGPEGGPNHRYEMSFRVIGEVEFIELALGGDHTNDSRTGMELERAGDLHYYRFVDPEHQSYLVEFDAHNDAFCGHVWQLDLLEGVAWTAEGVNDDDPSDGCTQHLEFETAPGAVHPDTDEYALVVTDYAGHGSNLGLGAFVYDLSLTLVE